MYKDKNKQRVAVRQAVRRHRAKGITKVLQGQGITMQETAGITEDVTTAKTGDGFTVTTASQEPVDAEIKFGLRPEQDRVTSPFRDDTGKEPIDYYDRRQPVQVVATIEPKPQSHNSMMVGYVPPNS